ncbi:MAG TPA: DUF6800 family protein [Blastocatellia bacterium]|nr:DUF6800 family protein [Blastocatellia bacterium]
MRIRNQEINRRRRRDAKRKGLKKKLEAATSEAQRAEITNRIRKTYPRFTLGS